MSDLGIGAQIQAVLKRAQALAEELPPLFPSWDGLCDTIADVDLAALKRHPDLEQIYANEFNPLVRAAYGSTEAYLRERLGWDKPAPDEEGGPRKAYWERDDVTNVRRNDWRYSVPADVRHYVVWVDLPLFHPLLCTPPRAAAPSYLGPSSVPSVPASGTATPSGPSHRNPLASHSDALNAALLAPTKGTWDDVTAKGLGGLTGGAARRWRARRGLAQDSGEGSKYGPEREIRAFVECRWPEKDGWETAWFANPPALQSVPGLAHFHVLARKGEPGQ